MMNPMKMFLQKVFNVTMSSLFQVCLVLSKFSERLFIINIYLFSERELRSNVLLLAIRLSLYNILAYFYLVGYFYIDISSWMFLIFLYTKVIYLYF